VYENIGMNIRLFRIKHRIDINSIVEEADIARNSIYKIERGELHGKSFVKYIMYIKSKGANLDEVFNIEDYN
jgi:DNA-binding XRE family transcriptional regulator